MNVNRGGKMNKKASMQLSINMIVILIIAVVILGLALGFVKSMFNKMNNSLTEKMDNEPDPPTASAGDIVTLSRTTVIANPGDLVSLKASVFCDKVEGDCDSVTIDVSCGDNNNDIIDGDIETSTKTIKAEKAEEFAIGFQIKKSIPLKIKVCKVEAKEDDSVLGSKDFTIKINT